MTEHSPLVYVIDDDDGLRKSLRYLLGSVGLEALSFATAAEFLQAYDPARPGCLLLDLRMPNIGGLELQTRLLEMGIDIPTIIITGYPEVTAAVRAMKAGAVDFIEKPFSDQSLIERVQDAVRLAVSSHREQVERAGLRERIAQLTPRECQVMNLVVDGLANKQIASRLNLSERTVEIHRAQVMKKLSAGSVAELVRAVLRSRDAAGSPRPDRAISGFQSA